MSAALFCQLLFCAITAAVLLVVIDMDNIFTFSTIISIEGILTVMPLTFFYCNQSENVTSELLSIGDYFYERAWYHLPLKHQKLIVLPIQRSSKVILFKGLGIIDCSLGVFITVREDARNSYFSRFSTMYLYPWSTDISCSFIIFCSNAKLQMNRQKSKTGHAVFEMNMCLTTII